MNSSVEKVFISHSSKNKSFVRRGILPQVRLANREHWYDEEDIKGGDNYREKILTGVLDDCQRLLVVVSKEAVKSEWVKEELTVATKDILVKNTKIDARTVHRKILPVKIDERDRLGKKIEKPGQEVDLFMLHPYLTLVNFISVPHNVALDEELDDFSKQGSGQTIDAYLEERLGLTEEQTESVKAYIAERDKALDNVATALRNPETLRVGFKRLGRLALWLANPTFQRVGLAVGLLLAIFSLNQIPPLMQSAAPVIALMANGETVTEPVHEISVTELPTSLQVQATGSDGSEKVVNISLVSPETGESPLGPPRVINLEIQPMASDRQTQLDRPTGSGQSKTNNVSLLSNESPQQEQDRPFEIIDGEREARQATAAGKRVWSILATTPNGALSKKQYLVVTKVPQSQQLSAPEIAIHQDGKPLDLDEISVADGPMELRFVATNTEGTEATRSVTIRPKPMVDEPAEIEMTVEGKLVTLDEIRMANDALELNIAAKNKQGTLVSRTVKLMPQTTTRLKPPQIEMKVNGKLVKQETGKPGEVRVANGPVELLVVAKQSDGTEVVRTTTLRPEPIDDSPAKIEMSVGGKAVTLDEIRMGDDELELNIAAKNKQGILVSRTVKLMPQTSTRLKPAQIEMKVDGELVKLEAGKSGEIRLANDPIELLVVATNNDGAETVRTMTLRPEPMDIGPTELEMTVGGKPVNLDEIRIANKALNLDITAKNNKTTLVSKTIKLSPTPPPKLDPLEIELSVGGKPYRFDEIRMAKDAIELKVAAKNKEGTLVSKTIRLWPTPPPKPEPAEIEMTVGGKPVTLDEIQMQWDSLNLTIAAKNKNGKIGERRVKIQPPPMPKPEAATMAVFVDRKKINLGSQANPARISVTKETNLEVRVNDGRDAIGFARLVPVVEQTAAPQRLVGTWNVRAFDTEVSYIAGTTVVRRDGTFRYQPRDGQANDGRLTFDGTNLIIDNNQVRFKALEGGRYQVGEKVWEPVRRGGGEKRQPNLMVPKEFVGTWNMRVIRNDESYIKGTITIGADGAFTVRPRDGESTKGRLGYDGTDLKIGEHTLPIRYLEAGGMFEVGHCKGCGEAHDVGGVVWEPMIFR